MKQFRHFITEISGLQYVYENLKICSNVGKSLLLHQLPCSKPAILQEEFNKIENHIHFLKNHTDTAQAISNALHDINDLRQTFLNLRFLHVLDDIELFEVKKFALTCQHISELLQTAAYTDIKLHDLSKIVQLLDPERSNIAHFYIYSCYDEKLSDLRQQIRATNDPDQRDQLTLQVLQIEDSIRQKLSELLHPYWKNLQENSAQLAELDLRNAKAQLAVEWQLSKPTIATTCTHYQQLFHPEVKARLAARGEHFQPINIQLAAEPCLITGANMSGKTVILKSLTLSQHLFQFGFFVPAAAADIVPVDEIFCLIDDTQSEKQGLSSFAVEILNINRIIETIKAGKKVFALVDELARTTNPDEGKRIVNAFVTLMQQYAVQSVVTTHYGGIANPCRRLRVNGLCVNEITDSITPQNIGRFMDYTLVETTATDVPEEALRIAEIFHADEEFLQLAKSGK